MSERQDNCIIYMHDQFNAALQNHRTLKLFTVGGSTYTGEVVELSRQSVTLKKGESVPVIVVLDTIEAFSVQLAS